MDTFTRLIFGDGGDFNEAELQVIATLRAVEPDVAGDDLAAMGGYLRALGVAEMIALVARVKAMPPPAPQTCAGSGTAQPFRPA